ncbi:MAG: tetratricopeptide repeat protein [Myxococcota bacterium]
MYAGEPAVSEAALRGALAAAPSLAERASALGFLGNVLRTQSRIVESIEAYEGCIAALREAGLADQVPKWLANLASAWLERGERASAEAAYREALAGYPATERINAAITRENLATLLGAQGAFAESIPLLRAAVAELDAIGSRRGAAAARANLANHLLEVHRFEEAERFLLEALSAHRALGNTLGEATALRNLGDLRLRTGALDAARTTLDEAAAACTERPARQAGILAVRACTALAAGDDDALAIARRAREIACATGHPMALAETAHALGRILLAAGPSEEGWALLREATDALRASGDTIELGRVLWTRARHGDDAARAEVEAIAAALPAECDLARAVRGPPPPDVTLEPW